MKKVKLKVVQAPAIGAVITAPPLIKVSNHTIEYDCGRCGVALMHLEEDQVTNVFIRCTQCGSYNKTPN